MQGLDDKREITVLLAVNMANEAQPGQVIYQGTTHRCHPKYQFPDSWNVTHTASHWSTKGTRIHYKGKVLSVYFCMERQDLGLSEKHRALLMFSELMGQMYQHATQIIYSYWI